MAGPRGGGIVTILETLRLLVLAGPIEIRALTDRMLVERFASHLGAAEWADRIERQGQARAVYVTMNPFNSALVTGIAASDAAVTARRWLLVDVDPVRPKDANSSKDELAIACSTARAIEEYLLGLGWPSPVRALSGNGAHLLYLVDLPNDAASKALVDGVLRHLSEAFSSERANVDTSVSNAARITKLYGTTTRKGPHSEERPHRVSKITRVPESLESVPLDRLAHVAALAPVPAQRAIPTGTYAARESAYDLGDILARVAVRKTEERDGSTWYLIGCPWAVEHSMSGGEKETALIVQSDGALGFKCLHSHCSSRGWEDVRSHLAIDTKQWKAKQEERRKFQPVTTTPTTDPTAEPKPGLEQRTTRVTVGDRLRRAGLLSRMDHYAKTGAMPGAISSGMRRFDGMLLGGFRPGKFYVLGGETGRGKTTLLMQWALYAAPIVDRSDGVVGIVSPEMDEDSLDDRTLSAQTGFGLSDYRQRPDKVRDVWGTAHIPQNIRASFDANDIAAFVEEERPALFIVDYAQQAVSYDAENRHTALAVLGAECLRIAKHHKIPVILGTQVNVNADREFTVRETRILEHQADAMVFIDIVYSKEVDGDGNRTVKSQSLYIAKNRHGHAGRIPINWEASLFRFSEA